MKKKVIFICLITIFTATIFIKPVIKSRTNNQSDSLKVSEVKSKKIKNKSAKEINDSFYNHERLKQWVEMSYIKSVSTFSELIDVGELTFNGEVINLHSFVYDNVPFTIADMKIANVLRGTDFQKNKKIRVLFMGGNIKKKDLLAPVASKKFLHLSPEDINSEKIVTVEYGNIRLPRVGEKLALVVSKMPKGTDNIPGEFWGSVFNDKSVFFENKAGEYKLEQTPSSIGGGGTPRSANDDLEKSKTEQMNKGMNQLIDQVGKKN
ncbi:hypothetical protein [Companilactobacillus sp. HBUAS56257]|uniref:hypothetical protein n=1 Tax=Companilactobacillus sp. HBUAS56257 TaxID=3109360 RepID=UPI002FEF849B